MPTTAATMFTLPTTASIILDSLAGYLTVVSLVSGFPLVEKFLRSSGIPTSNTLLGGDASQRFFKIDLRGFKPVECLLLYLVSYPITAAYRASSGSMSGCLSLVVVLIGFLVSVESATKGSIDDDMSKDSTGSFASLKDKNQTFLNFVSTPVNKRVSEMTAKSVSSIPESSPATTSTPTMSNTKKLKSNLKKKEGSSSLGEGPTYQKLGSDKDLEPILKNSDEEPVLKNNEEDDVPSIVTWEIANETTDPDILQKRNAHRREQSLIEGDLIDSNLEPHYSNLIDSANAPIFGVDSEGRVNVWNKCAVRIVGYTPDEVMGKNLVKEFITRDYQASVAMVIDRALRGDETANYEFPLMTKDNVRIEILLNATARRNPSGEIIGVVGIGQDITGRIAQEREYTRLIDTANAPIFGVDTYGRVNIWNQCAIQLVGYSTEEVMGKNLVQEFITDDFKTAVQAVLDEALHGEETANFEFPLMTKAGVRLDVLLNATTRRDEQGNVIGVVGIGQDITGRLAQEREYTRLIDLANAPIFGVDTHGRVNVWNQCAMRLVGYSSEEVMGHSLVKEFITDDFKSGVQAVLDMALQGDETENFEFPLITKGGARMVYRSRLLNFFLTFAPLTFLSFIILLAYLNPMSFLQFNPRKGNLVREFQERQRKKAKSSVTLVGGDTVYISSRLSDQVSDTIIAHCSPEERTLANSHKVGYTEGNSNDRNSHVNVSLPFIWKNDAVINVPKSCGYFTEQLLHYVLTKLNLLVNREVRKARIHISFLNVLSVSNCSGKFFFLNRDASVVNVIVGLFTEETAFDGLIHFSQLLNGFKIGINSSTYAELVKIIEDKFFITEKYKLLKMKTMSFSAICKREAIPSSISFSDNEMEDFADHSTTNDEPHIPVPLQSSIFTFELNDYDAKAKSKKPAFYIVSRKDKSLLPHDAFYGCCSKFGETGSNPNVIQTPLKRLQTLSSGSPYQLKMTVFVMKSPERMEKYLKKRYRYLRSHGEWHFLSRRVKVDLKTSLIEYIANPNSPDLPTDMIEFMRDPVNLPSADKALVTPFDQFKRHLIAKTTTTFSAVLKPLQCIYNGNGSLLDSTSTSLSYAQMQRLLIRSIQISKEKGDDSSFTGSKLISELARDERVGLNVRQNPIKSRSLVHKWLKACLCMDDSEFETLKNSSNPGVIICDCFSSGDTIPELMYENLHENWWLYLSNRHSIYVHNDHGVSRTDN